MCIEHYLTVLATLLLLLLLLLYLLLLYYIYIYIYIYKDCYQKIREQLVSLMIDCFGYILGDHSWLLWVLLTMAH